MTSWLELALRHPEAAVLLIGTAGTAIVGVILAVGVTARLAGPVSLQVPRMEIPSIEVHLGAGSSRIGAVRLASRHHSGDTDPPASTLSTMHAAEQESRSLISRRSGTAGAGTDYGDPK